MWTRSRRFGLEAMRLGSRLSLGFTGLVHILGIRTAVRCRASPRSGRRDTTKFHRL